MCVCVCVVVVVGGGGGGVSLYRILGTASANPRGFPFLPPPLTLSPSPLHSSTNTLTSSSWRPPDKVLMATLLFLDFQLPSYTRQLVPSPICLPSPTSSNGIASLSKSPIVNVRQMVVGVGRGEGGVG